LIFYSRKKGNTDTCWIKPLNYTFSVTAIQTVKKLGLTYLQE